MKLNPIKKRIGLCLAALVIGGSGAMQSHAQMPITNVIQTFDVDDANNHWGKEWGPCSQTWDGVEGKPVGSLLVNAVLSGSSDTPLTTWVCQLGNPWWVGTALYFSQYDYLEFDIKYDNTSDVTISQWNDVSTIPADATNSLGQTILKSGEKISGLAGLDITVCGLSGHQMDPTLAFTNIPAAAASGWAHIKVPINKTQANIDGVSGIVFHKWVNNNGGIANDAQVRFWIDNVMLTGTTAPPPPPTVKPLVNATQGLNVFASTAGLWDRQSAVLRQSAGLTWVGMASVDNPVTYSFSIVGYPNSVNCEAWMFLVPNPTATYLVGAPDWNETNCVKIRLQGSANNGTMQFQYKVNEPNQQLMYSGADPYTNAPGSWNGVTPNYLESGYLGAVTNGSILGKWTVRFTSDTNVCLIAPNGSTTNFIMPVYNIPYFTELNSPGFYIYIGMQANNVDAQNQSVVFGDFAVTGTASPYSENFLTDEVLDTTNVWNTTAASGPAGVLIVPAGSASWASWTLPDVGFSLQAGLNLTNPASWTEPATGPRVPMVGLRRQLLASSEIPAGNPQFYRMIKRQFTQLQVLLPGESNAPNTPTGKTGTPTPVNAGDYVTVTVNSVDSTFHVVSTGDTVTFTSSDPAAILPVDAALVGGTVTGIIQLNTAGSQTVTASDVTDPTKTSNTSSPLTVN